MNQTGKIGDSTIPEDPNSTAHKSDKNGRTVAHRQLQQQETHIIAVEMDAPLPSAHVPQSTPLTALKKRRAYVQCPHCLQFVYTKVSRGGGVLFFLCFIVSALAFVLFHMLYMIVFQIMFVFTLQDAIHTCPSCTKRIAKYARLRQVTSIARVITPIHEDAIL